LLLILVENRKPLLKAFVIASAFALLASFFVPQSYESTAQLLFEGTPALEREGHRPTPDAFVESAMASSRLREVRDRLGWDVSLRELEDQIMVSLESEAAMRIVGRAGMAEEAQALAQAMLDVFLSRQASFNAERLERLTAENRVSLERARDRREEASKAYEVFREKSGKPDLIHEQAQLLARGAELRARADEAAIEVAAQRARIVELEKAQRELPRQIVASATKGSPVDSPLAKARSELAAARASLSEHHPTVQALKQRVASLQAQRKSHTAELGEQTLAANPARAAVDQQLATARAARAAADERESALRVLLKATNWASHHAPRCGAGATHWLSCVVGADAARGVEDVDGARPAPRVAADLDGADRRAGVHRASAAKPDGRSATRGCVVGKRPRSWYQCLAA
jgi:uncharacterized protein involved in exopolysaccharide biosynthesis